MFIYNVRERIKTTGTSLFVMQVLI